MKTTRENRVVRVKKKWKPDTNVPLSEPGATATKARRGRIVEFNVADRFWNAQQSVWLAVTMVLHATSHVVAVVSILQRSRQEENNRMERHGESIIDINNRSNNNKQQQPTWTKKQQERTRRYVLYVQHQHRVFCLV